MCLVGSRRVQKRNDWIFIQTSESSHRANLVQIFLTEKPHERFVKNTY